MFKNSLKKLRNCKCFINFYTTLASNTLKPGKLLFPQKFLKSRQVWLENLDTIDEKKLGLVDLHPNVFACSPRIDIIHQNIRWQQLYGFVRYDHTKVRSEVRGGGKKPFPQKGLGRARHGSIRSPLFRGGGVIHGPRSPTTYFYMLPFYTRILGLTSILSIKLAQDDLRIVDNLDLPSDDPKFIEELVKNRNWGPSVLFIDISDVMSHNITAATSSIKYFNLMPTYGLNVYSMLKHDTVVLTKDAANQIEEKILIHLHKNNMFEVLTKFKLNQL